MMHGAVSSWMRATDQLPFDLGLVITDDESVALSSRQNRAVVVLLDNLRDNYPIDGIFVATMININEKILEALAHQLNSQAA